MMNVGAAPICCSCPAEGGGSHRRFRRSISGRQPSGSNGATFAALPLCWRRSTCLPVCESADAENRIKSAVCVCVGRTSVAGLRLLLPLQLLSGAIYNSRPDKQPTRAIISRYTWRNSHYRLTAAQQKQFGKASTSRCTLFQLDSTFLFVEKFYK